MEFLRTEKEDEVLSEWPILHNGSYWDGTNLRKLVYEGKSPFKDVFDVDRLTRDLSKTAHSALFDIIKVSGGANHYGFHIQFLNGTEVVARISRGDSNDPKFANSVREKLLRWNIAFESATYRVLTPLSRQIGHLMFHRPGATHASRDNPIHQGVAGRSLFIFHKAKGHKYEYPHWRALDHEKKRLLLKNFACVAGNIFNLNLSHIYTSRWLLDRIFGQDHKLDLGKVEPTREFCIKLFNARIHWILDEVKRKRPEVEEVCQSLEYSLLQLVPKLLPLESKKARRCSKGSKKGKKGDEGDKEKKGDEGDKVKDGDGEEDEKGEEGEEEVEDDEVDNDQSEDEGNKNDKEQKGDEDKKDGEGKKSEQDDKGSKGKQVKGTKGAKVTKRDPLYRFVLDHGDFGIHNSTIYQDQEQRPNVTSIFDWETGRIVPALLSEQKMIVTVDLILDQDGEPGISRWGDGDSEARMEEYMDWSQYYFGVLFSQAPSYHRIVREGREARRLWVALSYPKDVGRWLGGLSQWASDLKEKMVDGVQE
ncbi:hypothetical protein CDD81_4020 [Ophiocordyceps australis]|uniref:Uncharacterized protein n=1 Tax=Ophiocordyceps australis TaxID=1399860 RepID=A0A2C5XJD3_9HYPO|nr:hypothetical protein CDD81_4020 [Ophiocordyceps australis]